MLQDNGDHLACEHTCFFTVKNDGNATDLILQSPQPVVKVSAYCQMFKDTIHPKSKQEKEHSLKYDGASKLGSAAMMLA